MPITVTVLNSWNYNNYELTKECPDDATPEEINQTRKELQRLVDEAIRQKQHMDSFINTKGYARTELTRSKSRLADLVNTKPSEQYEGDDLQDWQERIAKMIAECEDKITELEDKINMDYNYEDDVTLINWKIPERIE